MWHMQSTPALFWRAFPVGAEAARTEMSCSHCEGMSLKQMGLSKLRLAQIP